MRKEREAAMVALLVLVVLMFSGLEFWLGVGVLVFWGCGFCLGWYWSAVYKWGRAEAGRESQHTHTCITYLKTTMAVPLARPKR